MKKLLLALAFAAALPAFAETSPINLSLSANGSLTNVIPANSTTTTQLGYGADLREWKDVGLQVSFKLTTTNVGNLVLSFVRSGSNANPQQSTYESSASLAWTIANNGTTNVVAFMNLTNTYYSSANALKLLSVNNSAAAGVITNLNVLVVRKR